MIGLPATLLLLIAAFLISLLVGHWSQVDFCALCTAVSSTWLILFLAWLIEVEVDVLLLGILMGGSAVGLMYMLASKVERKYEIFKLPFLLTLFAFIYVLLAKDDPALLSVIVVTATWVVFAGLFYWRESSRWKAVSQKIIECCKNW